MSIIHFIHFDDIYDDIMGLIKRKEPKSKSIRIIDFIQTSHRDVTMMIYKQGKQLYTGYPHKIPITYHKKYVKAFHPVLKTTIYESTHDYYWSHDYSDSAMFQPVIAVEIW